MKREGLATSEDRPGRGGIASALSFNNIEALNHREAFQDVVSNDHEREMLQSDSLIRGIIQRNLRVNDLIE